MLLHTFGGLALEGSSFQRPKPLLLLVYLSLEGPKPRRFLAELFYPGTSDPLNGLSRALSYLAAALPGATATIGKNLQGKIACDAKELINLLGTERLDEAIDVYDGPFLHGVDLSLGEELEEWVYGTREFLAARVRESLIRLAERSANRGDLPKAAGQAEAAFDLPGAPELEPEDFSRMYALLSAVGSPKAAVVRREAATFGLTLEIPQGLLRKTETALKNSLPDPVTHFVGRERELETLSAQLHDASCRLITVLGPGGVGKTRLVIEAARQLSKPTFPGGVYFLSLETLTSGETLGNTLADLWGGRKGFAPDLLETFGQRIGNEATLLVLDSCEHLTEAAWLGSLLDACPTLKVLATSRERLYSRHEHVCRVDGFAVPPDDEVFSDDAQVAALELFVRRAKRARLGFALTADEITHVLRICRLVGGFPLGIELAAAWVMSLAPRDIAREIERDRAFLASNDEGLLARHRDLRAVFEASWRRLGSAEKDALMRLSVFQGGFQREAAAEVAGASIPVLTSLVDRSMLRVASSGRYDRHELLHQFMRDKLSSNADAEARAVEAHGRYYHLFLQRHESLLHGEGAQEATAEVQLEIENIRLAWGWALGYGAAKEVRRSATPLRVFFDRWGRFQEGVDMFEQALVLMEPGGVRWRLAIGAVLVQQAWLVFRLGRRGLATSLSDKGLNMLRNSKSSKNLEEGLYVSGALRLDAGDFGEARRLWNEAYQIARGRRDLKAAAHALELMGIATELSGDAQEAQRYYRRSLDLCVHTGDKEGMVDTLNNLATLLVDLGNVAEAETLLLRATTLAHEVGARRVRPYLKDNLAKAACLRRDFVIAERLAHEALIAARESQNLPLEGRALETLGRIAFDRGDHRQAEVLLCESLDKSHETGSVFRTLRVLGFLAELMHVQGRYGQSAYLASVIAQHPAAPERDRLAAVALLGSSGSKEEYDPSLPTAVRRVLSYAL